MFFTKEDFRKIEEYLKVNGKKDTDFSRVSTANEDDLVVIVQNAINKSINVGDLVASGTKDKSITLDKLASNIVQKLESISTLQSQLELLEAQLQNSLKDNIKHIILSQKRYDSLSEKDKDTLYLIVEGWEDEPKSWVFGDKFPIVFTESWRFGGVFPITLV